MVCWFAGVQEHAIHCWRPTGESYVSELRRFFIGSSPELEDPTYIAVPSTFEVQPIAKYFMYVSWNICIIFSLEALSFRPGSPHAPFLSTWKLYSSTKADWECLCYWITNSAPLLVSFNIRSISKVHTDSLSFVPLQYKTLSTVTICLSGSLTFGSQLGTESDNFPSKLQIQCRGF